MFRTIKELKYSLTNQAVSSETGEKMDIVTASFNELVEKIYPLCTNTYSDKAFSRVEEAKMWLIKALVMEEYKSPKEDIFNPVEAEAKKGKI